MTRATSLVEAARKVAGYPDRTTITGRFVCPPPPQTITRRRESVLNVNTITELDMTTRSGERILLREVDGKATLTIPNHTNAKMNLAELQALGEALVRIAGAALSGRDTLMDAVKEAEERTFGRMGVPGGLWGGRVSNGNGTEFS